MKTLRDNLKRAKRMLASSPRDQLQQRQAEVERLERTVKRAESTVNKDKRDRIEQAAMQKVRQEEREKQKQGKTAWFMKGGTCSNIRRVAVVRSCVVRSRQEGRAHARTVRRARGGRWQACRQEGHREETEKGQPEGEEETAVRTWTNRAATVSRRRRFFETAQTTACRIIMYPLLICRDFIPCTTHPRSSSWRRI